MTLNLQSIDQFYGKTVLEYIQTIPGELPVDAVGLWQIIPMGRQGFGLSGGDLAEFVQRCVLALLEKGAKPVIGGAGTPYDWLLQPQYGEANDEIVGAIVSGLPRERVIRIQADYGLRCHHRTLGAESRYLVVMSAGAARLANELDAYAVDAID